jgi:hypothetical protein
MKIIKEESRGRYQSSFVGCTELALAVNVNASSRSFRCKLAHKSNPSQIELQFFSHLLEERHP